MQEESPCISSGRYGDDRGALPFDQTSIDDNIHLADDVSLLSSYPNPFNAITTIQYNLRLDCHVTIEIYDLLGRKTANLVNENQQAGHHQIAWNAADVPSGVYFARLATEGSAENIKMVLLK